MKIGNVFSFFKERKLGIFSLISFLIIWQFLADFVVRNSFLLPSFTESALALYEVVGDTLGLDISVSLFHWGIGITAAVCLGIPLGAMTGWFKKAGKALYPIIEVFRPIPPIAWIPFAIVWLGLSPMASGFIVFLGAFFPILINTYTGFREVDQKLVDSAKVLGCTKDRSLIRHVAFPSALPSIAAGIRIGMGIGWMCLVAAEMFGATAGLGYRLMRFYSWHMMSHVVAYMIALGLIGLIMDFGFRYFVENRFFTWQAQR